MSAAIVRGAKKNAGLPGFYFRFGAEGIAFAGGLHTPDPAGVAKVSEFAAVADRWPFIANKQFHYWAGYDDRQRVLSPDLVSLTLRHYRAGAKISAFLRAAVT